MTAVSQVRNLLGKYGISVDRKHRVDQLIGFERDIDEILSKDGTFLHNIGTALPHSRSQLKQNIFALSQNEFKREGFFVEFGATDGISLSNTYLLETGYGWRGILAEPAKCWHDALRNNRNCSIELSCVWKESGTRMSFDEVGAMAELSTLTEYRGLDNHRKTRKRSAKSYDVNTISLNDLLNKYDAPRQIDYLSIDTEGSEFSILSEFDFAKYRINVITCEHNYTANREKIFELLTSHGYERKYTGLSKIDDWYVALS